MGICSHGAASPWGKAPRQSEAATVQLSFLLSSRRFGAAVAASEFLDAPGGIDELLFAGKKGMTSRTNTDLNIAARGAGMIHRAARTDHVGLIILWMNACFHLPSGARNVSAHAVSCKR